MKDLRLEWRTLETISSTLVFSLIVLVVFQFAFGVETVKELGTARLVPGVIWIVVAFATVVSVARTMGIERRNGVVAALLLAPVDRGALFCGKLAANLLKLFWVQATILLLTMLFFQLDLTGLAGRMVLLLLLHGYGLVVLGTLFGAVASRVGRGEALLATLLFPSASPLLIGAVKTTTALVGGRGLASESHWIWMAAGFDLLYTVIALSTFEFVLEE